MSWQIKKIEEIVEFIQTGKTPPSKEVKFFSDDINWFNPSDFSKDKLLTDSNRKISNLAIDEKKAPLFPIGTVLITCIGDIGKVGICKQPSSSNQQITGIKVKNFIDNNYFYYWVKANKDKFEKMSNKAVVPIINNGTIKKITFSYPPLPQQKRIAQILDKADALRQKNKQLLAAYDELLQATFLDMFGDPVTNPKGWEKLLLEDCYIDKKNGTKCGPFGSALKKKEYTEKGIPVWTMYNIQPNKFDIENSLFIPPEKYSDLIGYRTYKDDIIISRAGTVGKMCIVDYNDDAIISTNLIRLRLNQ